MEVNSSTLSESKDLNTTLGTTRLSPMDLSSTDRSTISTSQSLYLSGLCSVIITVDGNDSDDQNSKEGPPIAYVRTT
jgi:hypothetical protein